MSLITSTTQEINDNLIASLQASLNQTIPLLPKSFLRVLAKVFAGLFILLYKYGGFIFLQWYVRTASNQDTVVNGVVINPLTELGRQFGVGDPGEATQAELLIDIEVTNQVGSLPSGSQLTNANNGVTYITIGSILLDSPTVQATIRAVSDQSGGGGAGVIGNLDPGATVSFANPLANINRDASVVSQLITGADSETSEVYRQRVLDRFQKPPQGGALADYEIWGEEPTGILSIYPYTSDCPGQVDAYVESATEFDGIPTPAQLQEALDSIELDQNGLATRRPANALANTFPIARTGFDVVVTGIVVDNLAQVQADITTGLTEYFLSREPFIAGLSVPPRLDRITKTGSDGVIEDVVTASGGIFSSSTLEQSGVPIVVYNLGIGEKSKLASVAFA